MKFPTHAVLSTTTGKLLGEMSGVYNVISFLVGRSVFTHELVHYADDAAVAIKRELPDIPTKVDATHITRKNVVVELKKWESTFGTEIVLPDNLKGCLSNN